MMKSLLVIMLLLGKLTCPAQDQLDNYLKDHHHAFSVDSGFSQHTTEILEQKLARYRIVFLGEGGSHYLRFYEPLQFVWLRFLSDHFGMTHFLLETGHSADILLNRYMQTGDTFHLPKSRSARNNAFLTAALSFNQRKPDGKKIVPLGIDFERPSSYLRALKLLIPGQEPAPNIASAVNLIRTSNETLNSCDYILSINKVLKKALNSHRDSFKSYLKDGFDDFEYIILNNGSCLDVRKNRNANMAETVLLFDKKFNDRMYYGQLGMAHTILTHKTTASILNNRPEFKDLVCVVNTYCYNCSTQEEAVSNWQLKMIEKDILDKLLKYCVGDFTLFDFIDDNPAIEKMRKYGQFLIIAKNQR